MKIFIRSASSLTAQETLFNQGFPEELINLNGVKLKGLDPDYKKYIAPAAARRMGRVIKMGVAAASVCMERADNRNPDAIIIGTALGCVEDTEDFLTKMIDNGERLLTPTSFIQSTHNTVGGQIALLIGCKNYNFTYVHRGFSFESALLDGMLLLKEEEAGSVLVGGIDELTQNHFDIYNKVGYWKTCSFSQNSIQEKSSGVLPGEGASFFILDKEKQEDSLAEIAGMELIYLPNEGKVKNGIERLVKENDLNLSDVDLVVSGLNGNLNEDPIYNSVSKELFSDKPQAAFKHYCGEFPTASGVGLYFSAYCLKNQHVPVLAIQNDIKPNKIRNLIFCNNFRKDYFSITLLKAC